MDLPMGEDLYESFIRYQGRVIEELDRLAQEFGFVTLDATRDVEVKRGRSSPSTVSTLLRTSDARADEVAR